MGLTLIPELSKSEGQSLIVLFKGDLTRHTKRNGL